MNKYITQIVLGLVVQIKNKIPHVNFEYMMDVTDSDWVYVSPLKVIGK